MDAGQTRGLLDAERLRRLLAGRRAERGPGMKVYLVMEDDGEYGHALLCTGQVYASRDAAEAAKAELDGAEGSADNRFVREFDVLGSCGAVRAVDVVDGYGTVTTEAVY